jgi:hypothetical protein
MRAIYTQNGKQMVDPSVGPRFGAKGASRTLLTLHFPTLGNVQDNDLRLRNSAGTVPEPQVVLVDVAEGGEVASQQRPGALGAKAGADRGVNHLLAVLGVDGAHGLQQLFDSGARQPRRSVASLQSSAWNLAGPA